MKIFLDTADPDEIERYGARVDGFTTNPTLMRKAGVKNYRTFAQALAQSTKKPVSLEVLSDEPKEIIRQAKLLAGFGPNVFVKVPCVRTSGELNSDLIRLLASDGVHVNVTAVTSKKQFPADLEGSHIVSLFAGRIADVGRDPTPIAAALFNHLPPDHGYRLLWASAREVLNVRQAEAAGCHIITLSAGLLAKTGGFGVSLDDVTLATVNQFYEDGQGYTL